MKNYLYILLFLLLHGCTSSNIGELFDFSKLNIVVEGTNREQVNLQEYIKQNKVNLVYFYSKNSCQLCFLNEVENLHKLQKAKEVNLVIVADLNTVRELKAFSVGYKFINT